MDMKYSIFSKLTLLPKSVPETVAVSLVSRYSLRIPDKLFCEVDKGNIFLVRSGHGLFENEHILLNKYSKTPGNNLGTLFAIQYGEYKT